MPLEIQHREIDGGIVVITVAGRIMLGDESTRIESLVAELLAQGHRKIVFDLAGVTHIDSTGIGRFIASLNKVFQAGGKMHMAAATGAVRDSFHVTRLDTVFKFFPDLESACAALR
ncbi:MAG: STAS domain-containing protein [Acidobacteriales bacterium]|nr:STAS domain-containing protein [Terriglobales bacterium]